MPQNQFLPFATGAGADTLAYATYSTQGYLGQGFQAGVAQPYDINTVLRQVTTVTSALGQFTANNQTADVLDDGVVSNFVSKFTAALQGALSSESVHYGAATGTNDALVVTASPPLLPTATETYQPGSFLIFKTIAGNPNQTTAPTINANSIGNIAITRRGGAPLAKGDLAPNTWYCAFFDGVGCFLVSPTLSDLTPIAYGATSQGGLAKDGSNNFLLAYLNLLADNRAAPVGADLLALERNADGATVSVSAAALASYVLSNIVASQTFKQRLNGNLDLYVRSDGSDSNNGLANTAVGAFKTIQGCWDAIFNNFDPSGYTITIHVGVGVPATYAPVAFVGYTGSVVLTGDPSNPTGTIVNCGGAEQSPINVPIGGPNLTIQNLVLQWDYAGTATGLEAILQLTGNSVYIGANVTYRCTTNRASSLYDNFVSGSGELIFQDGVTVTCDGSGARRAFITTGSGGNMQVGQAGGTVHFRSIGTISYGTFTMGSAVSTQVWYLADFSQFTATGNQASATGPCAIAHGSVVFPGAANTISTSNFQQVY